MRADHADTFALLAWQLPIPVSLVSACQTKVQIDRPKKSEQGVRCVVACEVERSDIRKFAN